MVRYFFCSIPLLLVVVLFQCNQVVRQRPLIEVFHAPETFSRRSGDFTANITGFISNGVQNTRYRINNSTWFNIGQDGLRVPPPLFTIELFADQLREGINHLDIEASTKENQPDTTVSIQFRYEPESISLPIAVNWDRSELDVYDGYWERISQSDSIWRVRPKPGFEDYDRILIVSGAFAGGRRIETDVIFRYRIGRKPFGFGVLALWGGSPDHRGFRPRRGWNFGLAWYYSQENGVGILYSNKYGGEPPVSSSTYQNFVPEKNIRYHIVVEAWPSEDAKAQNRRYHQRLKWWRENSLPPSTWIELADLDNILLPFGEFAIALIAHRCQVDFGPVVVKPLKRAL